MPNTQTGTDRHSIQTVDAKTFGLLRFKMCSLFVGRIMQGVEKSSAPRGTFLKDWRFHPIKAS
jgi:hypothetical protein